jgi:hypothetical protein
MGVTSPTKECKGAGGCGRVLPRSAFSKVERSGRKPYLRGMCKECTAREARERYANALPKHANVNNGAVDGFKQTRSEAKLFTIPFPGHWLSPLTGIHERKSK